MSSKTPLIAVITNVSFSFEQPPTDHNGDFGALLTIAGGGFPPPLAGQSTRMILLNK